MSSFYNPRKTYGLYIPGSPTPFKISRTKIDLFFKCPKCFYLDRVCGVAQPPGYPFTLNSAVDRLLKKEFDLHRAKHTSHPLMTAYGVDAVPFDDPRMDEWRDSLRRGVTFLHRPTNLIIGGGIDAQAFHLFGSDEVIDKGGQVRFHDSPPSGRLSCRHRSTPFPVKCGQYAANQRQNQCISGVENKKVAKYKADLLTISQEVGIYRFYSGTGTRIPIF